MLSLRKSINDLDRLEAMAQAAAEAFASAVETSAEHVVEVNPHDAASFRDRVRTLAARLAGNAVSRDNELRAARDTFRAELRSYSDKASRDVKQLKDELTAAAVAMQKILREVSGSSDDHERSLKRELGQFQKSIETERDQSEGVRRIRQRAYETIDAVNQSLTALKQSHTMVVTQMRDEIRVLQEQLERSQARHVAPKAGPGIEDLLRRNQGFGAALLHLPELTQWRQKYPAQVVDRGLNQLLETFGKLSQTTITEWSPGIHLAVVASSQTPPLEEWRKQLTACHLFQQDGLPRTLRIEPELAWVQHQAADPPAKFLEKLGARVAQFSTS